jgi:hypothetical protein
MKKTVRGLNLLILQLLPSSICQGVSCLVGSVLPMRLLQMAGLNGALGKQPAPGVPSSRRETYVFGFPRFLRIESPRISMRWAL